MRMAPGKGRGHLCWWPLIFKFFLTLDIQELIRVPMARCDLMTKQNDGMIKKVEGEAIKSLLDNALET
ncbi:MAG: hypothetical protein WCB15_26760 [Desulfobacterales bacterium]